MPKLVCVKCERELYPEKNGEYCLDMADFGPYQLYECDRWLQHWMPDFKAKLDKLEQKHTVMKNYGRGNK